jgi:hypothetical protein
MEKNSLREKEKNLKRKKNTVENILKEKKIQRKKFVEGVLAIALLYVIHGAFNPTQVFLHMTKKLL